MESQQEYLVPSPGYKEMLDMCHDEPWFHGNISRDEATDLVAEGEIGAFLLTANPTKDYFLLTHKVSNNQVNHIPIYYIKHPQRDGRYLSLDNGETFFQELISLFEYYMLNSGSLQCTLRGYISKLKVVPDDTGTTTSYNNCEEQDDTIRNY